MVMANDIEKEYSPHEAIGYIYTTAPQYAKAKGQLAQLEAYKHSLLAIMMKKSNENAVNAQEREAYASQEYQDLCTAIGVATEEAEKLKYQLEAAKMRFQAWQTESANNRQIEKMTL
jgi:chromosome segregation ATPase